MSTEQAIEQLNFHYQPTISRETQAVFFAESAIWWEHPQHGLVDYRQLFEGVQDVTMVNETTESIIDRVLADLPRLKRMFGPACGISVPVCGLQLDDASSLVAILTTALGRHNIEATDLFIELSADAGIRIVEPGIEDALNSLRKLGVRVVLSEFGNASISLAAVGEIAFDAIKIDKIVVQRMMTHVATRGLVVGIAAFCDNAGVTFIAEGVDDAMVLNELERLGCAYVQGRLFGASVAIEALWPRLHPAMVISDPAQERKVPTEAQLTELRAQIDQLDPRNFEMEFADFLEQANVLKAECAKLPVDAERSLRCQLGRKVTVAAVYAGANIAALDWGLETSNLAEDLDQPGTSAQMLSLISTVPVTTESSRFVRVEALSRALQIRATNDLDPAESSLVDNTLAMAIAHLGLVDRARSWWNKLVRDSEATDFPGHVYAAINLAGMELAHIEDPIFPVSALTRETALRRIDRAVNKVARSEHAPHGAAASFLARQAVALGDYAQAAAHFGDWFTREPRGLVPVFLVLRARAVLERAAGDPEAYLERTTELVETLADSVLLRHHRMPMILLHVEALTLAGRAEEALAVQGDLLVYEQDLGQRRITSMFDWLQIRVDVDLEFAHYADFARLPEVANPET